VPENTDPIAQLEALLDRIDPDTPRVVVRWVDETRIVPEGESGFTVGPVMYATFTLRIDGEVGQHRIDDISLQQIKKTIGKRPLQVLYRSDNITA
jgi:hypothetical protein